MKPEERVEELAAALSDLGAKPSTAGAAVELRSSDAEITIRLEGPEPALVYAPPVAQADVLAIRGRLPAAVDARAERLDGTRFALVVSATEGPDAAAVAEWARGTIDLLDQARASEQGAPQTSADPATGEARPPAASDDRVAKGSDDGLTSALPLETIEYPTATFDAGAWAGVGSAIAKRVVEKSDEALSSYRADPLLVDEHANKELGTFQGGYGRRQIYELVQNAADEMLRHQGGTIKLLLTDDALYCANEGQPVSTDGVNALLMSDLSVKRGSEIGRFGLGFKSVLAITRSPVFVSRSGSFRFDPQLAEQRIREIAPRAERIPYLRTAVPVDPAAAAEGDRVLRDLMRWATTVVKLPRDLSGAAWLKDDLKRFPAEFLLFSPHVGRIVVEDRTSGEYREVRVEKDGDDLLLREDGAQTRWKVFRRTHRPSPEAKADAGEIAGRDEVPVIWAVKPLAREVGTFWAFFPTEVKTTLKGIINAPWKTNEDRQNLLRGDFNEELLQVVAALVADNLDKLGSPEDPGRLLDLLPGRGREARSWADDILTEAVYRLSSDRPCLPDQSGTLRRYRDLKFPPVEVAPAALELWASAPGRPVDWIHPSVAANRERRGKADKLAGDPDAADYAQWLEPLTTEGTAASSIAALTVASACVTERTSRGDELRIWAARTLLTESGAFVAPDPTRVFTSSGASDSALERVHPAVLADPEARRILELRGIRDARQEDEYTALLGRIDEHFDDWDLFWRDTALLEPARAVELIKAQPGVKPRLKVRSVAGLFIDRRRALLPDGIVPEDGGEDAKATVDINFHASTMAVVRSLGIEAGPVKYGMFDDEWWYDLYLEEKVDEYMAATQDQRQRPTRAYLEPNQTKVAGPLQPMVGLSEPAVARFTEQLLRMEPDDRDWRIHHATMGSYPAVPVEDPVSWFLRKWGLIPTSSGPRPVSEAVSPRFEHLKGVLPVAACSGEWSERLRLPATGEEVPGPIWVAALAAAESSDSATAARLYATAAPHVAAPATLRCVVDGVDETRPAALVRVMTPRRAAAAPFMQQVPLLLVEDEAAARVLEDRWGLKALEEHLDLQVVFLAASEPRPLIDCYPDIRQHLRRNHVPLELVRCSELAYEATSGEGLRTSPVAFARDETRLYVLEGRTDEQVLRLVSDELQLALDDRAIADILGGQQAPAGTADLMERVRAEASPEGKLLAAIGRQGIVSHLPREMIGSIESIHGPLSDTELASLASSAYGTDLLREYRRELQSAGLRAPERWKGSSDARLFVQAMGLPRVYAGYAEPSLDPLLEVDGPSEIQPLHEFQEVIAGRIRAHLRSDQAKRGIVWLPTGAGKTRVTVEALIRAAKEDGLVGPILWAAPTKELCEQAVQTWAYVWRSKGAKSQRLSISRLWSSRDVEEAEDGLQVVVATEDQLGHASTEPAYQWLASAPVFVVDEAHGAMGPGYTRILHWLGLGTQQAKDRCALIGLTATPFGNAPGTDAESPVLRRFGSNLLTDGVLGDMPYRTLQDMRVLARVSRAVLPGGDVSLTPEQESRAREHGWLPTEVEQRLGADRRRTEGILGTILGLEASWKTVVFATSVAHAKELAALLNFQGVRAAAISSDTDAAARRHYVRDFNDGSLQVLTNYGVLAEGFDAPSTRVVIVARPTLSPVRYQQMIGRGLRGPLNGGKDECLIVDVEDNIERLEADLAFRQFRHLFEP